MSQSNSTPKYTYELIVKIGASENLTKGQLTDWLLLNGVESFVEGNLEVDFNHNYDAPDDASADLYQEMGGANCPISIYRYSRDELEDLSAKLVKQFGENIELEIKTIETTNWQEGWKESFRPIETKKFIVCPPWEKKESPGKLQIIIEPGMAFGTGQHATTTLCLTMLEQMQGASLLDVGTGTGILAIAMKKLLGDQLAVVDATDIEADAVAATKANSQLNRVKIDVSKGSVPRNKRYEIVVANILSVVLLRINEDLTSAVAPNGTLVLSGILDEEKDEVVAIYEKFGCREVEAISKDGWTAIRFINETPV